MEYFILQENLKLSSGNKSPVKVRQSLCAANGFAYGIPVPYSRCNKEFSFAREKRGRCSQRCVVYTVEVIFILVYD